MAAALHLYQLKKGPVVLEGELTVAELELESLDELIGTSAPLRYHLSAELFNQNILVQGELRITLDCQCVRCLASFPYELELLEWSCVLPLKGEGKVEVRGDAVDLRPFIREDTLLAFPKHPQCGTGCTVEGYHPEMHEAGSGRGEAVEKELDPTWAELDKLRLST